MTQENSLFMQFIKDFIKNNKEVRYILFFPIYTAVFFVIEYFTPTSGYWITDCVLDTYIPFIPEFIFFYVLWYLIFAIIGFSLLFRDIDAFSRWMRYTIYSTSACLLFCCLVPNGQCLRPEGLVPDSLATRLLTLIWSLDTNTNVYPSMHVITCIGNVCAILDSKAAFKRKSSRIILCVVMAFCASSTIFVKQHSIMDLFGAFTLAVPLILIIYGKRIMGEKKNRPPVITRRPGKAESRS